MEGKQLTIYEYSTIREMTEHRQTTHAVQVGGVTIGGDAPVVVQSMTDTDTADAEATARQCRELATAGAELVRVAVNTHEAAEAVAEIKHRLADLRSALEDEKTHDFEKGRAYIQMALRREIASRLGGLDAGLRATFPEDVQLQKAIEILQNPARYAEKMSASPEAQAPVR